MTQIRYPFGFDDAGGTALSSENAHKVEMLLQFLLTAPGERVNRPDFGTPLSRACFEGNSHSLAEVIQFTVRAGVQRWLGDALEVIDLQVRADGAILQTELVYRLRGETDERRRIQQLPMTLGITR